MQNNSRYLLLLLGVFMIACKETNSPFKHFKEKPVETIYPSKIVNLEDFRILKPFYFVQIDDSMFVVQDLKTEKIFNLINLSSKKVISGVNKGQGPNDVLAPSNLLYRNNKILVWDAMPKKMSELLMLSDTALMLKEYYVVDTEVLMLYRINQLDSNFIAAAHSEEFWLAEMNKEGKIISTIDYPIRDETKNLPKAMLPPLYSTAVRMANSPDNKRVVAASGSQGLISFLNRTDSGISEYKQIMYQAPKIAINPRGGASYTRDNIDGFAAIDCDDDHVYALYSGRTFNSHQMLSHHCEHLLVYDWDGNPVKRYILDIPIFNTISYDKENNCIYGLAENPEGVLIVYQL